jgi:DNA-binding transcriptional MerR regulator
VEVSKMKVSDERYREIEQALEVFSFRQVQALLTLIKLLGVQDVTVEEVKEFVEVKRNFEKYTEEVRQRNQELTQEAWEKYARRCPVCKEALQLRPIKEPEGKGNVKGYTSQWFCVAADCSFEDYGYENVQEIYNQIMKGTYNADN